MTTPKDDLRSVEHTEELDRVRQELTRAREKLKTQRDKLEMYLEFSKSDIEAMSPTEKLLQYYKLLAAATDPQWPAIATQWEWSGLHNDPAAFLLKMRAEIANALKSSTL